MRYASLLIMIPATSISLAQWEPTNNPHTQIRCLATQGDMVIAGTAGSGIRISPDGGDTWSTSTNCCAGIDIPYIWTVMIEGNEIYVGASSGLYRTTIGGAQWTLISNGLIGGPLNMPVHDLLRDGQRLFAALGTGIFRSENNGGNWSASTTGIPGGVNCIVRHGPYLLAGSMGAGVFRSADDGDSWTEANTGLGDGHIRDILSADGQLYLATNGGVFRSSDNGDTWSPSSSGLLNTSISALLAVNGQLLAASSGGGVHRSIDNGASWSTMNAGLSNTLTTSLALNDAYVYVGNTHSGTVRGDVWRQPISLFTGLHESSATSPLRLYPSLTQGLVILEDDNRTSTKRHILVRDHVGKVVQEFQITAQPRSELYLDLPPGTYTIEVRSDPDGHAIFRVVKDE